MTHTLRTLVFGLVLSSLASSLATAQGARARAPRVDPMTARVTGLVTAAETGVAVAGAEVRLSASSSYRRLVTTDAEGRFDLNSLPGGQYRLTVTRAGYTQLEYGQRRPFESPRAIDLPEGGRVTANVVLPRSGVIRGRVVDAWGEPVAGTRVQAMRVRMVQGRRRLEGVGVADQTDDTGAYRVYGLPPGDYYVAASAGAVDAVKREPPVFYPGTPSVADAQPITVASGAEATADFQLVPVRAARVSGVVLNSSGVPVAGGMIALVSEVVGLGLSLDGNPPSALRLETHTDAAGAFVLDNVPPGPYVLTAQAPPADPFAAGFVAAAIDAAGGRPAAGEPGRRGPTTMTEMLMRMPESSSMSIAVADADVSEITVVTRPPAVLTARVVRDAGVVRALPAGVQVRTRATQAGGPTLSGGRGGQEFQVAVTPGPFRLDVAGLPDGWVVRAVTIDDRDVTDEAIDLRGRPASARIVLTDRIASVDGVVQSRENTAGHSVVVFADDEAKWTYPSRFVRAARTDDQGRFEIKGLPPGERYVAVAVDYLEEGEEQDAQVLGELRGRSTSFLLGDGERRSIRLDLVRR